MDATIMPSTALLDQLRRDYPEFTFELSDTFRWSPDTKTLSVDVHSPEFDFFALHELGHALLNHQSYARDIDLLKIERDAWEHASNFVAPHYGIIIDIDHIQNNLDTYRDWLHARSKCPACHMTGLQTSFSGYSCLACGCRWKSNDARNCALRRYKVTQ